MTQTIFASSYGHGVYESTNGGATWTALSGGPSDVVSAAVSSTGVYYASDGSNLWAYAGGKWTELTSGSAGNSGGRSQSVQFERDRRRFGRRLPEHQLQRRRDLDGPYVVEQPGDVGRHSLVGRRQ